MKKDACTIGTVLIKPPNNSTKRDLNLTVGEEAWILIFFVVYVRNASQKEVINDAARGFGFFKMAATQPEGFVILENPETLGTGWEDI